jgi:hypothetical protein
MQRARRKGNMSVGYMDPSMITETLNHIINYLDKHYDKACIELPYNFG